jgi:ArsR family metal-binding transcriptional regulator
MGRNRGLVRVLARSSIAPRQQIVLVEVGARVLVLGDSAGQLSSLAQITDPDEVAQLLGRIESTQSAPPTRTAFASLFGRETEKFGPESVHRDLPEASETPVEQPDAAEPQVDQASAELGTLLEKVRMLKRQMER